MLRRTKLLILKYTIYALLVFFAGVLQTTPHFLEVCCVRPDLVVPLAVCICLKYSRAAEADADGDPVEVLLHDRTLLGMAVAFAALVLALLYL